MGTAATKAKNKYNAKMYDQIKFEVKKGRREKYKIYAATKGMSLAALITKLLEEDMQKNGFRMDDTQSNADQNDTAE